MHLKFSMSFRQSEDTSDEKSNLVLMIIKIPQSLKISFRNYILVYKLNLIIIAKEARLKQSFDLEHRIMRLLRASQKTVTEGSTQKVVGYIKN
jgi:hypothetical protein